MAWKDSAGTQTWDLISDDSYCQPVAVERVPTYMTDGVPAGWTTRQFKMRVRERVTEHRGLTRAAAFGVANDSITVIGDDGFSYESYSKKISRRKANPSDGWTVTITEKWCALYMNGERVHGADEIIFTSTTPPSPSAG